VSTDLRVLREVGFVTARDDGRRRVNRPDARPLRPIHDWVRPYERMWERRFVKLDAVLEELVEEESDERHDRR
jgi:hypothetical protein